MGMAPKDQSNGEEQVTKVDGLEVYVLVWVIHILFDDQAKRSIVISSGLVKLLETPSLQAFLLCGMDKRKAKVWNIGCFILPAIRLLTVLNAHN